MIYIFVQIKFRSFLVTWGFVRQVIRLSLPVGVMPTFRQKIFNDRGVLVEVASEDLWTGIVRDVKPAPPLVIS